jgi:hypothetical protein
MGADERYQDFAGGLYPDGKNVRPAPHEAAGLALAGQIRPLDRDGHADPAGTIVLLAIGMSNTNQAFGGLQRAAAEDRSLNPRVTLVNGAIGGMTARRIQRLEDGGATGSRRGYWGQVDERLADAKVTRAQVQAVWLKQADGQPTEGFPSYAKTLEAELGNIVRLLHERFPNLKQVYLSSRAYGGWAKTPLNPEPYAYESGFSVKWLIEAQLRGDPELNFDATRGAVKAPWLSWGPYLWTRGATPSADGFAFEESDFAADGTHESPAGQAKIGRRLLDFFKTDSTTRTWFCAE